MAGINQHLKEHITMKTFQFVPGLSLRVVDREGEPWFVAKDVCDVLDLKPDATNGSLQNHMRRLDADEATTMPLPSGNSTRKQYVINESGLYSLILKSRKPEAKAFKRWITGEVLGGPTDRQGRGIPLGKTTHGPSPESHT